MMFNDPLSGYGIGIAVPAAYWMATFCFFFFSIPYVEMARRVTTAGGMYSYMTYGFGRVIGLGTAVAIAAAYMIFVPGILGAGGYFAHESILDLSGGYYLDWRIYTYCFIVLLWAVSYFHVETVARLLGFCLIGEILVLMIFSFAVVREGGWTRWHGVAGAQPGGAVPRRRGIRRRRTSVRRRAGRHRLLLRVLVLGGLRDGAELRGGGAQPQEDDGRGHLHLLPRARALLHVLGLDARLRLRLDRRCVAVGSRHVVRRRGRPGRSHPRPGDPQLRKRLLPRRARTSPAWASRTCSRC